VVDAVQAAAGGSTAGGAHAEAELAELVEREHRMLRCRKRRDRRVQRMLAEKRSLQFRFSAMIRHHPILTLKPSHVGHALQQHCANHG
jgi:hypothetical protein